MHDNSDKSIREIDTNEFDAKIQSLLCDSQFDDSAHVPALDVPRELLPRIRNSIGAVVYARRALLCSRTTNELSFFEWTMSPRA